MADVNFLPAIQSPSVQPAGINLALWVLAVSNSCYIPLTSLNSISSNLLPTKKTTTPAGAINTRPLDKKMVIWQVFSSISMDRKTLPEVWLRGPVAGVPALLQPVAHALLQAREEVTALMQDFPEEHLWDRPAGVASPGFHLQHLAGVLDRLFTYAAGQPLSQEQLAELAAEGRPGGTLEGGLGGTTEGTSGERIGRVTGERIGTATGETTEERVGEAMRMTTGGTTVQQLMERWNRQIDKSLEALKQIPEQDLTAIRGVGRAQLPSTVLGLLVHAAEHTQRHTGQLLVTVRILFPKITAQATP